MAKSRMRASRVSVVVTLLFSGMLAATGLRPGLAQVSDVQGRAYGYYASVSIFNGAPTVTGPVPIVDLPPGGSANPVSGSAPSGRAVAGPNGVAAVFSSGPISVSTQGTTGPTGSVTSSTDIQNVNTSGSEVLTASRVTSSCTASETGRSGSTTITGGTLQTDSGDTNTGNAVADHPAATVELPANPAPNTEQRGHLHIGDTTDNFRYVFNEQITNPDGSITVNAAHMYLLGPNATGDLIIGQSVCGVTATASTPTTTAPGTPTTTVPGTPTTTAAPSPTTTTAAPSATTTTAAPSPTTTAAPSPTTTAAPSPTTTAAPSPPADQAAGAAAADQPAAAAAQAALGGGAYGYFASVTLFGGAPATRGPEPSVTLPEAGANPPLTATAPSGRAAFGPAELFTSGRLEVSTEGATGSDPSVQSSASVANVGPGPMTAGAVRSTCTASQTGETGSVTVTEGRLVTSEGDPNATGDETTVSLAANPAPNTSYEGKLETVGDSFRVVLNEQQKSAGSITVNAVHLYLLGPTAVGDLIIGQSRCSTRGTAAGGGSGGGAGGRSGSGGGGLAGTGTEAARTAEVALGLVIVGWVATVLGRRRTAGPWSVTAGGGSGGGGR